MLPTVVRPLFLLLATVTLAPGCRAIRQFGESRQSIAARRLSGQGFQAMHEGQWDVAETLFADALQVSKTDDRAHRGLAEAYWNRGEQDLAIQHMEQAVRLSAGDPKIVQRLGRMYLDLNRTEEATEQCLQALRLERESPQAWALRGDCLRAEEQYADALAAYHRALALQPDYPDVQIAAAEIYEFQQRYDRLLATLDRLQDDLGIDEAPARVDMLQGIAMRQLGRTDEARRCFARASFKDPQDASPHLELASIALEQGDAHAAKASLELAQRLNPESVRGQDLETRISSDGERVATETEPDVSRQRLR